MIPDGWTKNSLEHGVLLISGQHVEARYVNELKLGEPYLTGPADFADGKIVTTKYTSAGKSFCEANDILVTVKGSGTGKIINADKKYAISRQLMAVRATQFNAKFAYYLLLVNVARYGKAAAGLIPGISRSDILSTPVRYPPLPEQTKIAKILSTWDEAIATVEKLIENSKQQKKALMQQLLTGKKRLPGYSGKWNSKRINQISTRIQRKTDGGNHPILTISSLAGFVTQEAKYSRYMAGVSVKNYILLREGEFAYNKGNSKTYQFGCIFRLESFATGLVPHVYVCFRLNDENNPGYFKHLFESDYLSHQLGALVNTGVRNNGLLNIKPEAFLNTVLPIPPVEEQERIASILNAVTAQLSAQVAALGKIKSEKKALMQQLLTGKRRVKVDAEETAELPA